MQWRATRVAFAGILLSAALSVGAIPSQAQQAQDLDAQLAAARAQVAQSSQSLAAAKAKLAQTTASLADAKTRAANLQTTDPVQIDQLKQQLAGARSELDLSLIHI